jgi:hypothetical protein
MSSSSSSKIPLSGAERSKLFRQNRALNETPEDREHRLKNAAEKGKIKWENQTPEERVVRLQKDTDQTQLQRGREQPEQREVRLSNASALNTSIRLNASEIRENEPQKSNREREKAEKIVVRSSKAATLNASIRLNASEIREKEIAARGFIENWMLDAKDSNPYYKHALFAESHNKYDWPKAINESWQFGYRRTPGYVSLEFFWNKECGNCGATYLNGSSKAFRMKCCKDSLFDGKCPPLQPLIDDIGNLIIGDSEFRRLGHSYNNRLSYGATGVDNEKGGGFEKRGPVSAVTISGRLYHFIGKQSSLNVSSGIGAIFFDQPSRVAEDSSLSNKLDPQVLQIAYEVNFDYFACRFYFKDMFSQ